MNQLSLEVENRNALGSSKSNQLRKAGKVPAILYGQSGNKNLSVTEVNLRVLLRTMAGGAALVELTDEKGEKIRSVLHDTQRDPCTDKFLHVDFREVAKGQKMEFNIPIDVKGESIGVKNEGAMIEVLLHEVTIRCLPRDLPEKIEIDVTNMHAGSSIHLKDLNLPEGAEAIGYDEDQVFVVCALDSVGAAEDKEAAEAESKEAAPAPEEASPEEAAKES